jgi:alkylation response protein AidB-like acyl-CoA dehydrogenase
MLHQSLSRHNGLDEGFMDFELNDDQLMLQDSLQKFASKDYTFDKRREYLAEPNGLSEVVWMQLAEQGILGIGLPEEHGGFGSAVEVMVAMEQIGRSLMLEPFLSTVVLCGGLIRDHGTQDQQAKWLPKIIAGESRMALAHHEIGARYCLDYVQAQAQPSATGFVLSGKKTAVLDGAVAHQFIVSAKIENEMALFIVDAATPGVHRIHYRTHDGRSAADVEFKQVKLDASALLGSSNTAFAALCAAIDQANAALCAEAVGAIDALNQATVEYSKSRKQFGLPIGKFQVLQHRMADMFIAGVQARSMSLLATAQARSTDRKQRGHAISSAKAYVAKTARQCGQSAVQLHGGMGMTDELAIGHYFKRLTLIAQTFGDENHHLAVVSDYLLENSGT